MGMSSGGGSGGAMAEINVTPLVDVMLVLLIIFMVTAPMMNTAGVSVELPRTEAPPMDRTEDPSQVMLAIKADLTVYIGEEQVAPDELAPRLAALAAEKADRPVFLRADGDVPYREVAGLLGIARRAGMPKVGLVFEPGVPQLGQGQPKEP
jgi:biopolymer transport protein TolR